MGRKKTLAGKIRDCMTAVRMWDSNPVEGAEYNKQVFVKALKGHLEYADESGEEIPEDLKTKATKMVQMSALKELRAECDDMDEFARRGCEEKMFVSRSQGRRTFCMLGDKS